MPDTKKNRPTFYLDEAETEKPVRAGGVIFYRRVENKIDVLLVENKGYYEDLGGCTDEGDKDIYDTVAREVEEESNNIFKRARLRKRILKADYVYMTRSKYIVYIIEASKKEAKLKQADFGDREIHDNFARTVKWIPMDIFLNADVIKHKLNFRLKNKNLFDKIKQLGTDAKYSIRIDSDEI